MQHIFQVITCTFLFGTFYLLYLLIIYFISTISNQNDQCSPRKWFDITMKKLESLMHTEQAPKLGIFLVSGYEVSDEHFEVC